MLALLSCRPSRLVFLMLPALCTGMPAAAPAQDLKELAEAGRQAVVVLVVTGGSGREIGQGTGFFIGDGVIATNHHVISQAAQLRAVLADGRELPVKGVLAWDEDHDLALVQVEPAGYRSLLLADDSVGPGDDVVVIGNPLGYSHTLSTGVVAAVREGDERALFAGEVIQITAAISSGSSGSPVMNLDGGVVAVVASTSLRGQNLNFAIPVEHLRRLMRSVREGGLQHEFDEDSNFTRFAYARNVLISLLLFGGVYYGYRKLR